MRGKPNSRSKRNESATFRTTGRKRRVPPKPRPRETGSIARPLERTFQLGPEMLGQLFNEPATDRGAPRRDVIVVADQEQLVRQKLPRDLTEIPPPSWAAAWRGASPWSLHVSKRSTVRVVGGIFPRRPVSAAAGMGYSLTCWLGPNCCDSKPRRALVAGAPRWRRV